MTDTWLLHEPEGDRNPYDPVPWSRTPLEPTNYESFELGVQCSKDTDSVTLEWRSGDATGSVQLTNENNVWSGRCEIGRAHV